MFAAAWTPDSPEFWGRLWGRGESCACLSGQSKDKTVVGLVRVSHSISKYGKFNETLPET